MQYQFDFDDEGARMKVLANEWHYFNTAPRDGTPILACRNNDCGWDHAVIWWSSWSKDKDYPWVGDGGCAYAEDRFDYWQPLSVPYDDMIENGWLGWKESPK